ncbi:hypothetical protein SNE40_013934 [Patella caerulea]|uniref:CP-type G domain-containing protein n=1 Tax=Patella caerulea TaxID=87958 RepID=A0AAN8JH80_PATCE
MANSKFHRKKSKVRSLRMEVKVKKKVKEHKKKLKKAAKKNPQFKKGKRDPGIPNSLPDKELILQEAEKRKHEAVQERERQKELRKKEREKLRNKKRNLDSFVQDALKKQKAYEKKKSVSDKENSLSQTGGKPIENSLKTFYKEFRKVIDQADVILEVLDARDPLGSRCQEVEQAVLSAGTNKKLVLLLNKIDLVPKENVEAWLKYLRNEFPTIAFKASTQSQSENLSHSKLDLSKISDELYRSSHCLGAEMLMNLLRNYCRNQGFKMAIRVGVVGFPNTGKSSIINSLKRSKTCNVGATPGVTRMMQEIQLDKHIKLLDSPGVVMATGKSDVAQILRNVVKIETLPDPIEAVDAIVKRCNKEQLMLHYSVVDYKDVREFLALLATRLGKLNKGGIPNVNKAARIVLQDWVSGKITYFTHPPEQRSLPSYVSAEIVTSMSEAFNVDSLKAQESRDLDTLKGQSCQHMLVESVGPIKAMMEEPESEVEMSDDDDVEDEVDDDEVEAMDEKEDNAVDEDDSELSKVTVSLPTRTRSTRGQSNNDDDEGRDVMENVQLNKDRQKEFKQLKKKRKRADVIAGKLSEAMNSALMAEPVDEGDDSDDNYNFDKHFN